MRKASLSALLVLPGFLFAACGGSSDDGGGGAKTVSIDELPAEVAKAQCALYQKCFGDLFQFFTNGEDCLKISEERVKNAEIGQLAAAVASGKVKYDGAMAAKCLEDIAARSCAELANRLSDNCDAAAEGSAAVGEDCSYDLDCKGTAFCKLDGACPGKCTERLAAGGACKQDDDCQDGLVCGDATQACVKPGAVGEPCGGGVQPECGPTLFCVGDDDAAKQAGTCKALTEVFAGKAGDTCAFQDGTLCATDLSCVHDAPPPASGKCAARVGSGAACKRLAVPSMCPIGEYCDGAALDGTCKALPGPGQPCVKVLDSDHCAPYSRCDGGTCVALQKNGGPCGGSQVCYSESCVSGTCKVNACQ
ncbi:MAG: hypothetical protein AMXMBFR56_14940 [Polyangiaceae bacterium]